MQDYLSGSEAARPFFTGSPFDPASFQRKWREVSERFGPEERAAAAAALRPTSERAAQRLARFVEEGGAVVTTGQQAGLFSGPLYTIYKALSAVVLAERLEALLGVVVLPVFWCASEDHDWAEVNHTYVAGEAGLRRLELWSDDARPLPMSRRPLEADVKQIIDEFADMVGREGDACGVVKQMRGAYRPGETVAGAFRAVVEEWLAPFDVLTTDAADPALKRASAGALEQALVTAAEQERTVSGATERLAEAGYGAQVAVMPNGTNLFLVDEHGRERLYRSGDRFVAHDSGRSFRLEELREALAADPERLSPNVFLRPVVESVVFPSLAYVAGPGEISYFAQLGPLFAQYGITSPVVYPRASVVLTEAEVLATLESLGLTAADLRQPRHELVERLARGAMPEPVSEALKALRESTVAGYRRLMEESAAGDPPLQGALGRLRNEALARLQESERKILRQIKRRDTERLARLDQVLAQLRPNGAPQERVLNAAQFLARHGEGLLRAVKHEIEQSAPAFAETPSVAAARP